MVSRGEWRSESYSQVVIDWSGNGVPRVGIDCCFPGNKDG